MIGYINNLQYKISLRAVVYYLNDCLRKETEKDLYQTTVAESLCIISAGMKREEKYNYTEQLYKIRGIKINKDTRTAQQIIEDTFKAHNIVLKK